MKKTGFTVVDGSDDYGNGADLSIRSNGNKIEVYSSEEGGPVVFTVKEARHLVEVLQKAIKECVHA